jgi:hypothetical protein
VLSSLDRLLVGRCEGRRNFEVWWWLLLDDVVLCADPFADANAEDSGAGSKDYVHVRVQQRNGRKSLTTVQGLKKEFNYNKILKDFKKVSPLSPSRSTWGRLMLIPLFLMWFGLP